MVYIVIMSSGRFGLSGSGREYAAEVFPGKEGQFLKIPLVHTRVKLSCRH